jgi:uncharacterized protein YaiI (UPF0178 family)
MSCPDVLTLLKIFSGCEYRIIERLKSEGIVLTDSDKNLVREEIKNHSSLLYSEGENFKISTIYSEVKKALIKEKK